MMRIQSSGGLTVRAGAERAGVSDVGLVLPVQRSGASDDGSACQS